MNAFEASMLHERRTFSRQRTRTRKTQGDDASDLPLVLESYLLPSSPSQDIDQLRILEHANPRRSSYRKSRDLTDVSNARPEGLLSEGKFHAVGSTAEQRSNSGLASSRVRLSKYDQLT